MAAVQCNSREVTTECLWPVTEYPGYCDAVCELTKDSAKLINLGQHLSWGIASGFTELVGLLPACVCSGIHSASHLQFSKIKLFHLDCNSQSLTLPTEKLVWKNQPGSAQSDPSKGSLCNLIYTVWLELSKMDFKAVLVVPLSEHQVQRIAWARY